MKCIKDYRLGHGTRYVRKMERYFHKLFEERHETLLHFDNINIRKEDQNHTFYHKIRIVEVKEVLKWMVNAKVVEYDNITVEVWKYLGGKGISWIKLFNEII